MATSGPVRPNIRRLTDADARHLLADGLIRTCALPGLGGVALGPSRVALEIGCDEKTVRRARDEESTLGLACTFNLLDVNPHALDALVAAKGFLLTPMLIGAAPDAIAAGGAVIHKLGLARSTDSPGGTLETDEELEAMEGELLSMEMSVLSMRSRIASIKLGRAA